MTVRRCATPPAARPARRLRCPAGAVWLYGTHAVAAALANPARRLRRLVITEEAQAALAAERPQPWPIQPEIADREKIDQLLGARQGSGIVHQGVALLTDQLAAPPLLDALKRPGPILVLDQISDPRNIGALMRTAQAFGAADGDRAGTQRAGGNRRAGQSRLRRAGAHPASANRQHLARADRAEIGRCLGRRAGWRRAQQAERRQPSPAAAWPWCWAAKARACAG